MHGLRFSCYNNTFQSTRNIRQGKFGFLFIRSIDICAVLQVLVMLWWYNQLTDSRQKPFFKRTSLRAKWTSLIYHLQDNRKRHYRSWYTIPVILDQGIGKATKHNKSSPFTPGTYDHNEASLRDSSCCIQILTVRWPELPAEYHWLSYDVGNGQTWVTYLLTVRCCPPQGSYPLWVSGIPCMPSHSRVRNKSFLG